MTAKAAFDLIKALQIGGKDRRDRYDMHTKFYEGGQTCAEFLRRHKKESDEAFKERQARFASLNYTGALSDQIIDGVYGEPWERRIVADKAQEATWEDISKKNRLNVQQTTWGWFQVVLGDAFVRVWYDDVDGLLRIQPVHPKNIDVLLSDRDPLQPELLIETQEFDYTDMQPVARTEYLVWTADEMAKLGFVGTSKSPVWIEEPAPNPYEVIPYPHWRGRTTTNDFWGVSAIRDVVTMQRMVHNRTSMLDRVILMQTHGQLVVISAEHQKITSGEDSFLGLTPTEQGTDAKYIQPGAKIQEVQGSIENLIDRIFEVGRVPVSAVKGGSANSGFQLVMEFRPMIQMVNRYKMQAVVAEEDLLMIVGRVGSTHDVALPFDVGEVEVSSPANFLPVDHDAEFLRDLRLYQSELMLREDFVDKWIGKGQWTEKELREYLAKLDKEFGSETEDGEGADGEGEGESILETL